MQSKTATNIMNCKTGAYGVSVDVCENCGCIQVIAMRESGKHLLYPASNSFGVFLMHVRPKRFVRIRHYGLLSSRIKEKKITLCRNLLGCQKYISVLKDMTGAEMLKHLWQVDICLVNHAVVM